MKVLFLAAGKSIHTVKWVNSLAKRGMEIHLVYNKGHEANLDKLDEKIQCHCLKYKGGIGYYLNAYELRKLSQQINPDVINVHYASGYGTLVRWAGIKPVLLSVWGSDVYDFPYHNFLSNRILKRNINYARMLASTSNCMADQLRKVMGKNNLEIFITPFGIDMDKFNPVKFQSEEKEEIVLGNIKALEKKYGIDVFLESIDVLLNNLREKGKKSIAEKIRVRIYGDGSEKDNLKKRAAELNLTDIVKFCGRIPNSEVPKCLSQFDVFCATSDNESFGVAVIEAMAMEIPVVVSDASGFCEIVRDGETGLIIPKRDAQKTAEALESLIMSEKMRTEFGKAGRKYVRNLYDWEKNVDMMIELYEKMMELKDGRKRS